MEGITTIKVSDLTEIYNKLSEIHEALERLIKIDQEVRAYTIQQVAKQVSLSYQTVLRLVNSDQLHSKSIEGDSRKKIIPHLSLAEWLNKKNNTNQ